MDDTPHYNEIVRLARAGDWVAVRAYNEKHREALIEESRIVIERERRTSKDENYVDWAKRMNAENRKKFGG